MCGAWGLLLSGGGHAESALQDESLMRSLDTIGSYYENVQRKLSGQQRQPDQEGPAPAADRAPVAVPERRPLVLPDVPATEAVANFLAGRFGDAPASQVGRPGYRDDRRNPFAPTRQIIATAQGADNAALGMELQPLRQATEIPRMKLKGLISEGASVAALLQIDNAGTYIVREGDTVGLYESGSNSVIRVRKINRLNLMVEAGSLGQVLIVR